MSNPSDTSLLLTWQSLTLHLRNPFVLSYGATDQRQAFWLRLRDDQGWGEGTIPPYYRVDPSAMVDCWEQVNRGGPPPQPSPGVPGEGERRLLSPGVPGEGESRSSSARGGAAGEGESGSRSARGGAAGERERRSPSTRTEAAGQGAGRGPAFLPPPVRRGRVGVGALPEQYQFLPDSIDQIPAWIPDGPAPARSAIDLALHDRLAKKAGLPLYRFLGLPKPPAMATSFTISIDSPEAMARMAKQIGDYPIIKLKLGSDDDESRVRAVREARPDAKIRVDANAGWSLEQAIGHLKWLETYDLELIEQPLGREQIAEMGELQKHTRIPTIADESVQSLEDVEQLGRAGVAGINLKLMKVGGLGPALAILKRARELKMRIMLGCMIETSLGTTAMAHLAGAAEWIDLDAPLLISNDPFEGIRYDEHARISIPDRPGIGVIVRSTTDERG